MSRVEYDECGESGMSAELWAAVARRVFNGKRGQGILRDLEQALVSLPRKRLISGAFCEGGEVCALGALAVKREMQERGVSREDALKAVEQQSHGYGAEPDSAARFATKNLGLSFTFAWEVMEKNDQWYSKPGDTPEARYDRMLAWVRSRIRPGPA